MSVIVTAPARAPVVVGVNVTLMAQLAAGATLVPQLLAAKSPLVAMLAIINVALPVLVNVAVCDALVLPTTWLPKARLSVERLTAGPDATPVPFNAIVCGLPGALSVIVIAPESVPRAPGVNMTVIVQLAPAARLLPQLFDWAKLPFTAMLVMVKAALPVLLTVTVCGALVVPTACAGNVRTVAESTMP